MKWAIMMNTAADVHKALKTVEKAKHVKLLGVYDEYDAVTFKAKLKHAKRIFRKLSGISTILDYTTFTLAQTKVKAKVGLWQRCTLAFFKDDDGHRASISHMSPKDTGSLKKNLNAKYGSKVQYTVIDELAHANKQKEDADGKTISTGFRVCGKARPAEAVDLPAGEDGPSGGEDGRLPDADPGRSADTGERSLVPPLAVPDYMTKPMTVDEYSRTFGVPTRTVRSWAEKDILETSKKASIMRPEGITLVRNKGKFPWREHPVTDISPKGCQWQWLDWTEYARKLAEKPE